MGWSVEMEPNGFERFSCFTKAITFSSRLARRRQSPIRVNFDGPKENGNHDPKRSDFLMHPNGHREFEIDPTWHAHKG